jgi:hypothetical protein
MNPPDDADILLDENYYENNSSGERETERDRERTD